MPRRTSRLTMLAAASALALAAVSPALAAENDAHVRVLHASPDAPAVDVYVNDTRVLTNVPFKVISNYLPLPAGTHQVKVTPTGDAATAVIDAPVTVEVGKKYTVAAINPVASIEPLVLTDNVTATSGTAKVRIVHLSPDAGNVDVAPDGGDALIEDLAYKADTGYVDLPGGAYDLEVRAAGTTTVALDLPSITLENGKGYSVFAVGTAAGSSLDVVLATDAILAPETDTIDQPAAAATGQWTLALVLAGAALVALGGYRLATVRARR